MRGLFIALLLANLAFAGWLYHRQTQADGKPRPAARTDVAPILLLGEKDASIDMQMADTGTDPVQTIKSLPGSAQEKPEPASRPAEKAIAKPGAVTVADACYTLGPFRELDKLREVIRALKGGVQQASFRSSEEREQSLFWVYLKPESDLRSAKNTTRMLRQKKIKDSYIIAEGDKKFGISLGHFKEKPRAYGLSEKVLALGFNPEVEPVFKNYTIYWLDYKMQAGRDSTAILSGIELGKNISRFDRSCE